MSLRQQVHDAVQQADLVAIEALVRDNRRAVRYLVGMGYQADESVRRTAADGIALAASYHPELIAKVIKRLLWALDTESNTNATTVPKILHAIAERKPELLLPVVPNIVILAADTGLHPELCDTLRLVASRCPGKVGENLSKSLDKRLAGGGCCGSSDNRNSQ